MMMMMMMMILNSVQQAADTSQLHLQQDVGGRPPQYAPPLLPLWAPKRLAPRAAELIAPADRNVAVGSHGHPRSPSRRTC